MDGATWQLSSVAKPCESNHWLLNQRNVSSSVFLTFPSVRSEAADDDDDDDDLVILSWVLTS